MIRPMGLAPTTQKVPLHYNMLNTKEGMTIIVIPNWEDLRIPPFNTKCVQTIGTTSLLISMIHDTKWFGYNRSIG